MKKMLSVVAIAALSTASFAADDIVGAFKDGKANGQLRGMYIKTDNKAPADDTTAFALGGKLAYETAPLHGISVGAAFYTSQDLGTKDKDANKVDGSLYDENGKSYSILGQAYIAGTFGKTTVKVGRQQLDTPLAGSDDTRMIPNLFEAALLINTDLPDTTLIGGYVSKMAGWDSRAGNGDILGLGLTQSTKASITAFQSMSRSALGGYVDANLGGIVGNDAVGDNGVYVLAVVNNSVKDLALQAWEYRAVDVLNAVYLQADYKLGLGADTALNLAAQYYNIQNIGKTKDLLKKTAALDLAGKADYSVYGVKAGVETPIGLTPYIAYNKVSEQKDSAAGGTFVFGAWGGVPEFTQTEELWSDSANLNNASIVKIGADYNLEKIGLGARTLGIAYTMFDLKNKYQGDIDKDKKVLDVVYTCAGALVKNLDARIAYTAQDSKNNDDDKQIIKVVLNYNF